MDVLLIVLVSVSTVCTCFSTCFHAWIAYKKYKEPQKDEIWETAIRLYCANGGGQPEIDDFAHLYLQLKALKKRDKPLAPLESFEITLCEDTHKAED